MLTAQRLPPKGPPLCAPDVTPAAVAIALETIVGHTDSLVLSPSDRTGWFGGTALASWSVREAHDDLTLQEAADMLEAVETGTRPAVAAALVTYEGAACVRVFGGGALRTPAGWTTWGDTVEAADVVGLASRVAAGEGVGGGGERPAAARETSLVVDARYDMSPGAYEAAVERTREEIAAGNVYVANVTYRVDGRAARSPADAFAVLDGRAAAPMGALLRAGGAAVASVSPERFAGIERHEDGTRTVEIWPIKGTRPRSGDPGEDRRLADELRADEKERAEHVMIVDMERNDLGRVCAPGTVTVDPLMEVFSTPYCHQMVSKVRGELAPETSLARMLDAAFPCGSVTGAPKIAAMRFLQELESSPRGAYCGMLAVAMPGRVDSSVLIRTLEYAGGSVRWGTGGGITFDSNPESEWRESVLKTWPALGD